ncbi:hypothetical protein F0562_025158 [Nyssa sinensis]|uniref:Uncharacterized protein n=1 Tax=Nyssa sinensis TaxID=561372 RepID=A0A5J5BDL3_9ASTE|nr:hypothetical protein F0562_025158 [Nyssa sinensis]
MANDSHQYAEGLIFCQSVNQLKRVEICLESFRNMKPHARRIGKATNLQGTVEKDSSNFETIHALLDL